MLAEGGPFSTFARKIKAGYAMRVYDEAFETNLNIIRTVRNAFAHSKRLIEFDHPLVAAELKKIAVPSFRKKHFLRIKTETKPQSAYALLCLGLTQELMKRRRVSAEAGQRRSRRKEQQTSPLYRALAPALTMGSLYGLTDFSEALKSTRLSTPQNQTADPSSSIQGLRPDELLALQDTPKDTSGK
jgi:hypothetical protein